MGNNRIRNQGYLNQYSRCWLVFEMLFFAPAPKILFDSIGQFRTLALQNRTAEWPYTAHCNWCNLAGELPVGRAEVLQLNGSVGAVAQRAF
jgi:hypothetical protein